MTLPHIIRATRVAQGPLLKRQIARSISVGTDLKKSSLTWQPARPWFDDGNSNLAADNELTMEKVFAGKKVAVFGVPAPFTGTCSYAHVPPYKKLREEFTAAGVDSVVCYSVSCPYANYNWGLGMKAMKITFVSDVGGEWSDENDLTVDYSAASLGKRSKRFSMIVDDGVVKSFNVVEDASGDAEVLLEQAKK